MKTHASIGLFCIVASFALTACSNDETVSPVETGTTLQGTLAMDIRGEANVALVAAAGSSDLTVTLSLKGDTLGLFDPETTWNAAGKVEIFPEADLTLYTAELAAPAWQGGGCGAEPVSVALSLARRGKAARVAGSLTVYCGANRYVGVPAGMLRLAGELH